MKRQPVELIPFNEWPEDAQGRLIDDVLAECDEPRRVEIEPAFWICFAAIVSGLVGLIIGMMLDFLVRRFSS